MDNTLLVVILISFLWGYILLHCIRYLIRVEAYHYPYARFFSTPIVPFIYVVIGTIIYSYQAMSPQLFLYNGFASVLFISVCTDFINEEIYDLPIIVGSLYTLILQIYIGQGIFALLGGVAAFLISFAIFMFGNYYYSFSNVETEKGTPQDDIPTDIRFALVPSLSIAVMIHALLPNGLASYLLDALFYIQSHAEVNIVVVVATLLLLIKVMRNRTYSISSDMNETSGDNEDSNITVFGEGDVTISIFMGIVLGMQEFIAVFWLGMVIHSIIGVTKKIKQKGDLRHGNNRFTKRSC